MVGIPAIVGLTAEYTRNTWTVGGCSTSGDGGPTIFLPSAIGGGGEVGKVPLLKSVDPQLACEFICGLGELALAVGNTGVPQSAQEIFVPLLLRPGIVVVLAAGLVASFKR